VRSGPMWGLIDREGKQVAPQVYSHIEVWETGGFASLGFAPAKREDGARGYVTVVGRFVLDGQSEEEWRTPLRWDVHFGKSRDELLAILQDDKIEESWLKPGE